MGYSKTQFLEQIKETSSFFSRSNDQIWQEISVFAIILSERSEFWYNFALTALIVPQVTKSSAGKK